MMNARFQIRARLMRVLTGLDGFTSLKTLMDGGQVKNNPLHHDSRFGGLDKGR